MTTGTKVLLGVGGIGIIVVAYSFYRIIKREKEQNAQILENGYNITIFRIGPCSFYAEGHYTPPGTSKTTVLEEFKSPDLSGVPIYELCGFIHDLTGVSCAGKTPAWWYEECSGEKK